jgi:Ras family protein T1
MQRYQMQPEEYTRELGMSAPLHVSATWGSVSELWATVAEAALFPGTASPRTEPERKDRTNLWIAGAVAGEFFLTPGESGGG